MYPYILISFIYAITKPNGEDTVAKLSTYSYGVLTIGVGLKVRLISIDENGLFHKGSFHLSNLAGHFIVEKLTKFFGLEVFASTIYFSVRILRIFLKEV